VFAEQEPWKPKGFPAAALHALQCGHGGVHLHATLKPIWEPLTFELPIPADNPECWHRCIDAALPSPHDIALWKESMAVMQATYVVRARSIALLARATQGFAQRR